MTGLSLPVRPFRGRAMVDSGDRQMAKVIVLALSDGDSSNPYNDAGVDLDVFSLRTEAQGAILRREIRRHFSRWEADLRARLIEVRVEDGDPGELRAVVRYVDLETDEEGEVVKVIRRA